MSKLMILGAGVYQVPLIKKAKELGIYTIVVSIPGDYPGFAVADKVFFEDTTNKEAVLQIARDEKIDGIVTTGTDVAIITIGYICDALGLKGVSCGAAQKSCSKSVMKDVFKAHGIRCADGIKMSIDSTVDNVERACLSVGYPAVIKAVDSSGSRGITVVNNKDEIAHAVESVKSVTRSNEYLVEEFLSGEEYGADAYILNGEVELVIPHGKYVYYAETGVPVGHYIPYKQEVYEDTVAQVTKAIKAMGFNNCAVNADIMLCDGKAYILEIGARAGATCIPELVSIYQGYDYYEKMIRAALGERVSFKRNELESKACAAKLLYSEKSGVVKSIDYSECEYLEEIIFDVREGDFVNKFRLGPHRIGHIVASGDTVKEAEDKLERAEDSIRLEICSEE